MGKLLPILLAIIGLGGGVGAGLALRPEPAPATADGACPCDCEALQSALEAAGLPADGEAAETDTGSDYVKLNNQFVVPIVKDDRIGAMVVLSISLEVPPGATEPIYQREPKLRDLFLQVLFGHANSGGFDGAFTEGTKMDSLRNALLETAQQELGNNVRSVLITDMAKQDM